MAQTVGTHGVAVFTSPSNGDTLDATVVKGNDNNLRSAYVDHDADGGLHVQSSSFATRSSPGSLGRKWLTTDTNSYRLFFDDGSAWYEVSYLSSNGGTVTGDVTVTGTLTASVTGSVTGNASTATALQTARNINGVAFNGTADITVTAAAGTLSGSTLNSGVTASSLTSVGTLSTLQVSGNAAFDTNTLFVDSVNNRVGVGTAAPTNALDVAGSARVRSELILDGVTKRYRIYSSSSDELFFARDTSAGVFEAVPLRIDVSGNLGLGVTPSAWGAGFKVMQIGATTSLADNNASDLYLLSNARFDGTNFRYLASNLATYYAQENGAHQWQIAPSGIAGNAITFTQAMTLDASGQLGIGTATPARKLHITVENGSVLAATDNGVRVASDLARLQMTVTGQTYVYGGVGANSALVYSLNRLNLVADSVSPITFHTGTTVPVERMRLDATGNLGLGTTTPAAKLHVSDTANATILRLSGSSGNGLLQQFKMQSASGKYNWFIGAQYAVNNGFEIAASTVVDGDTPAAPMFRLTSDGNLGLGVTPSAWTNNYKGIELSGAALTSNDTTSTVYIQNGYVSGGQFLYKASAFASSYSQSAGQHQWRTAPSGTAGAAISFTQAMTLNASGDLGVGTATPTSYSGFQTVAINSATNGGLLEIQKAGAVIGYLNGNSGLTLLASSGQQLNLTTAGAQSIAFNTNATNRWSINSTGNFVALADATYDIGAVGARPKDVYLSGNVVGGGWVRAGAASAGVAATTTIGSTTATTVGATGAAAALPANPLGYIIAHVGTTQVKIPYYTA